MCRAIACHITNRACGRWRWAASASSTAISAPARSMRSARRWWPRAESARSPATSVLGVLSLILWSLIIVVTIKYVVILLRADNNGEGGTLSLTALATRALGRRTALVFLLGVVGAAMFLGDCRHHAGDFRVVGGRRVEARDARLRPLRRAADHRHPGRAVRGAEPRHRAGGELLRAGHGGLVRGDRGRRPARTFATIRGAARPSIRSMQSTFLLRARRHRPGDARPGLPGRSPAARRSMPTSAISDASRSRPPGSVWCCRRCCSTISGRARWCSPIPPRSKTRSTGSCPRLLLLPMVVLATAATVIASQAVITGAYSLVHQAIQLGLLPRLAIAAHIGSAGRTDLHSARHRGSADRGPAAGRRVPHLERARLRLRHRGHHHDGGGRSCWPSS